MLLRERTSDTLAVWRGLGARALSRALARRALSAARALGRAAHGLVQPPLPAASPLFARALGAAPSPLAERPDVDGAGVAAAARAALATPASPIEADPRLTWEEGRGGRLVRLAAGVRVTSSPELRADLERLIDEWVPAHRIDDTSAPLEAALRAWNLWVVLGMVPLEDRALATLARALVEHGRFLVERLEDRGLVVGSHLIGELVGLYACGAALRAAGGEPASWRAMARAGLAAAAREQVLADGGGAEGSTGYARFVCELWVAALACARALREEPPPGVRDAAQRMLGWLQATMAPDGRDVCIGDDDDSRVLPGTAEPRDLVSLAPLLSLGDLEGRPEGIGWSDEAGWLAGAEARARWLAAPAVPWAPQFASWSFGLFLARRGGLGGDMVTLRAGPPGQGGAGGHAHNDPLSIAVWMDGEPAIIDPGTGLYLGRPALRDRFRGVAAHATLCVDGQEPSPLLGTRPFALPDRARARVTRCEEDGRVWRCVAEHRGYRGITHRRELTFDREERRLVVTDTLLGSGSRRVALGFPLAANDVSVDGGRVASGRIALVAGDADGDKPVSWRVDPGLVSSRYGTVSPSLVARRSGRVTLPVTLVTIIRRK